MPSVAWSHDGAMLASGDGLGELQLWDAVTGKKLRKQRIGREALSGISVIAWSPTEPRLAVGNDDGIVLYDAVSGKIIRRLQNDGDKKNRCIRFLAWSHDGTQLVSGGGINDVGGRAVLWDIEPGRRRRTLVESQSRCCGVAWSPDGVTLAIADDLRAFKLWKAPFDKPPRLIQSDTDIFNSESNLAWSHDSKQLAIGRDIGLKIWDAGTEAFRGPYRPGFGKVEWSPDGHTIATCQSINGVVGFTDAVSGRQTGMLLRDCRSVSGMAWSPQGERAALTICDITGHDIKVSVRIMSGTSGEFLREFRLPDQSGIGNTLSWSPDGQVVAVASLGDTQVNLFAMSGLPLLLLKLPESERVDQCIAWSGERDVLAVATGRTRNLSVEH